MLANRIIKPKRKANSMENKKILPLETKDKKKNIFVRGLIAAIKSPINTIFLLALLYFAFQTYILGHASWSNKMLLIATVCLWIGYQFAKYAFKLVVILIVAAALFFGYLTYTKDEADSCLDNGKTWDERTQTCVEKDGLIQKVQKLWQEYVTE